MHQQNLPSFIWSVADLLRGDYKQSEYGRVILPIPVLRLLDCVLEPTKPALLAEIIARLNELYGTDTTDGSLRSEGKSDKEKGKSPWALLSRCPSVRCLGALLSMSDRLPLDDRRCASESAREPDLAHKSESAKRHFHPEKTRAK